MAPMPPSSPNCTRRVAGADMPVRYEQGISPLCLLAGAGALYRGGAVAGRGVRARARGARLGGAAFIGAFVALLLWQGGNFFRRNRPGTYRPDALPRALLPRVYDHERRTEAPAFEKRYSGKVMRQQKI